MTPREQFTAAVIERARDLLTHMAHPEPVAAPIIDELAGHVERGVEQCTQTIRTLPGLGSFAAVHEDSPVAFIYSDGALYAALLIAVAEKPPATPATPAVPTPESESA